MKRLCVGSLALACLAVAPLTMVGRAAQETRINPDISGFWELNFDSRKVPRASLLPSITRAKIDARARGDDYAVRWCNLLGVPFVMDPGRPLDIRQGATAVIIAPENASAPRYLYTNRATHISDDIFDPSTNGDSIAHWEGDTLVVDTVGLRGDTVFDVSGAPHSDAMRVTERIRRTGPDVIEDRMVVEDPKALTKPWTVVRTYERKPDWKIAEYVCEENQRNPILPDGSTGFLGPH